MKDFLRLRLALVITLSAVGIINPVFAGSKKAATTETGTGLSAAMPSMAAPEERKSTLQSKLSFSGLKLQGQLKKPDLSYIYKRRGLRAEQIVNIPEDFNEEIVEGAGRF